MNLRLPPASFDASGAFETCRVEGGKILHLREHLLRLSASLQTLGVPPVNEAEIQTELAQAARAVRTGSVRIAVCREGSPRWLIHRHRGFPYSRRQMKEGIDLTTVPTRWPAGESAPAKAKGSERLSGILARLEGKGKPEVLRIGPQGYLTEGTVSNLFMVKEGILTTPPGWLGVLEGVTRAHVIAAARRLRIPVREIPFTRHDLFNAEEAFLTNVLMTLLPIRRLDGREIGTRVPGRVTKRLMHAFSEKKE